MLAAGGDVWDEWTARSGAPGRCPVFAGICRRLPAFGLNRLFRRSTKMNSRFPLILCLAIMGLACKPATPAAPPSEPVEAPAPGAEAPTAVADPEDVRIEGDHLVIDRHINFAFDSHEILEDSFELLDHVATLLKNHPEITKLHVIGHTDSTGSAAHNQELSAKRANSVMEALRSRGATQQIDAAGKGMTQHLCQEDTEACHEKNRRVEFVIEKAG
jgi:peptidoglycan-associated lipoprotein